MPSNRKPSSPSTLGALGALSAVGIAFVLAIVIGAAVGYWLDRLTGLSPLFFLLFFLLGLAAGVVNVVRTMASYTEEDKGGGGPRSPGPR